ncbi:hypothetical protein EQG63_00295 [Flavobacterium amnicola]|uniref:Outer membrane protein beta-barrel domain-containing protein n=1 Tax=Flavobacterium amnicola TaxID=2506422 RepID=A0A4Q1K3W9_9FLAO|nr:hypothetical protein [Flavobacterium amnicola]RXR20408.1 hypothetical protein EQG63_00295 [Flavobacterium amnicola]
MKKLLLTAAAVFTFGFANAQEGGFKVGINAGMPIGTSGDIYSFTGGVDAAYLWNVGDKFNAGVTTGYAYYSGKEFFGVKVNGGFIPVAGTAQYSVTDNLFAGADLGYGLYAGDGNGDGGFYYQPKFGYQTEKIELYAGYKGVSVTGGSIASVNLGFNYKF